MPASTNFELSGWLTLGSPYLSSYGVLQNNLQSLSLLRTFQPKAVGSSRLLCCRSSRVSKLFREAIKGAMGQWATFYLLHSDPKLHKDYGFREHQQHPSNPILFGGKINQPLALLLSLSSPLWDTHMLSTSQQNASFHANCFIPAPTAYLGISWLLPNHSKHAVSEWCKRPFCARNRQ